MRFGEMKGLIWLARHQLQSQNAGLIDIEGLIRDRSFQTVEQHINDVLECSLESEFDVRILDSGVVKLFRLAQLTVEYQQFCRQYLERSVLLLRDELAAAMQELEKMRREIRSKDEEIRKMRRKPKAHRTPLPYGNENIATMILRTLSNRGDIFAGTSIGEAVPHYNQCQHCEKVFLNQLYLQSHISRRHPEANRAMVNVPGGDPMAPNDLPEKMSPKNDVDNNQGVEIALLRNEVKCLQEKLRKTESLSKSILVMENGGPNTKDDEVENGDKSDDVNANVKLLEKFEEWKQQENSKYHNEISELRKQLVENMNTFKDTVLINAETNDIRIIEQLKATVKNQENQIMGLKEEISKVSAPTEAKVDIPKELQEQEEAWRRRTETLEQQHGRKLDRLLRTLEAVYKEVKAARELGEAERARATELSAALAERDAVIKTLQNASLSAINKPRNTADTKTLDETTAKHRVMQTSQSYNDLTSKQTLLELHKKAQELLSRNTESDSETSDTIEELISPDKHLNMEPSKKLSLKQYEVIIPTRSSKSTPERVRSKQNKKHKKVTVNRSRHHTRRISGDVIDATKKRKKKTSRKEKISSEDSEQEIIARTNIVANQVTSSPVKVVRAKLAEEVNSRLQALGVDPLRRGVPADAFRKQRSQLQHSLELKAKTDATYSKMRNRIMTYLDSKVTKETELAADVGANVSPSKQPKNLKVFSIFSNVKHKALSFLKPSEKSGKMEKNVLNDELAKKAAQLLKTPPGSAPSSPAGRRRPLNDSRGLFPDRVKRALNRMTSKDSPTKTPPPKSQSVEVLYHENGGMLDSNEDMTESDEATSSVENYRKKSGVQVVTSAISHEPSKSIENLIKSPIRRPAMFNGDGNISATSSPIRPPSATPMPTCTRMYDVGTDSDQESNVQIPVDGTRKFQSEETLFTRSSPTSTKGVLKNAPSISSLSKKKVLFDLEANQMKSVSASPSQSVTEGNEAANRNTAHQDRVINVNNDWEISSIEELPVNEAKTDDTRAPESRRSPKIAELTQRIESQLARRPDMKKPVGAIEVMVQNQNATNVFMSGSNTSVGSSMLDDSNEFEVKNILSGRSKTPVPAPRYVAKPSMDKDASDLDVSDWSIDDILKESKLDALTET